jgi:hypothetical protein
MQVSRSPTNRLTLALADRLVEEASRLSWRLEGLCVLGGGIEFTVFGADIPGLGPVALRVPRPDSIGNENDPYVDTRLLLKQEATLLDYGRLHGLPTPAVITLHRGERCDFLATGLIETDRSTVGSSSLGRLAAVLHLLEPPPIVPVADPSGSTATTLAQRVARRAAAVERLAGRALGLPAAEKLRSLFEPAASERRLLHMDLRVENLLVRDGRIAAIVDWSNALLGDPELDLARVEEYGLLDAEFLAGYEELRPRTPAATETALAYRLDTAVMLAVVFLSEAPDKARAEMQLSRIEELARELRARF